VRSERAGALVAALALLASGLGACSSPVSYVVLTLKASSTSARISGVTDVTVVVTKGTTPMKTLTYHHDQPLAIDQNTTPTLSVSFSADEVGNVAFQVDVHDARGCTLGSGLKGTSITKGGRADATVLIDARSSCPGGDGGAGDGGDGGDGLFPGCDPVHPTCGPNMTCLVSCEHAMGECTAGGSGTAGSSCSQNGNADCMPGTQCFDYTGTGCPAKVCLRFCNADGDCSQPGDGGIGPGSFCQGPVQCGTVTTAYHTCTFSCDPRQAALPAATGCPAGLACLVVGGMDQVDCACPEPTRTKQIGDACNLASDCAPGLICNLMGTTQKCRAVCRCDAQGMTCTAHGNDCPGTSTCAALTNDTIYGVCI
jgi:hypothetical protein